MSRAYVCVMGLIIGVSYNDLRSRNRAKKVLARLSEWPQRLDNKRVQPHLHPPTILKDSNSLRKLCHHCLLVHPPTTCGLWSTTLYCRKSRLQIRSRASFEPRQTSCSRALSRSLLFTKSSRNTSFCVLWPNWKISRYYHDVAVQRYPPKASGRLNYDNCNLSGESLSSRTAKKL